VFYDFVTHEIFVSVVIASIICQGWKFIDKSMRKKKIYWPGLTDTGGMPSSHSTFVCALAISIGFVEGFLSTVFFLSLGFATIVVRDAIGVRRAVDRLNDNVNEIIKKGKFGVKEILKIAGHTPVQAFVGIVLGVLVPLIIHYIAYV